MRFSEGISLVTMLTTPPVKSAGRSAEADLMTIRFSRILVGKISIWTVFLSGSRPRMSMPFKMDLLYRSPSPRTYTYFPPCTDTPGTERTTLAIVLAPARRILCAESPSRSEDHTYEIQALMRISYDVLWL